MCHVIIGRLKIRGSVFIKDSNTFVETVTSHGLLACQTFAFHSGRGANSPSWKYMVLTSGRGRSRYVPSIGCRDSSSSLADAARGGIISTSAPNLSLIADIRSLRYEASVRFSSLPSDLPLRRSIVSNISMTVLRFLSRYRSHSPDIFSGFWGKVLPWSVWKACSRSHQSPRH